jgi:DNA-binding response OmpR family regulator
LQSIKKQHHNLIIMSRRILILEDDEDPPSFAQAEFCYKQFQVLVTSDGKNLIEIAKKFNPDLFILDYTRAGHNSEDICRQIQWRRQFGHIPTILSSDYLCDAEIFSALGCEDILFKPYGLEELIAKASGLVLY